MTINNNSNVVGNEKLRRICIVVCILTYFILPYSTSSFFKIHFPPDYNPSKEYRMFENHLTGCGNLPCEFYDYLLGNVESLLNNTTRIPQLLYYIRYSVIWVISIRVGWGLDLILLGFSVVTLVLVLLFAERRIQLILLGFGFLSYSLVYFSLFDSLKWGSSVIFVLYGFIIALYSSALARFGRE